VMEYPSVKFGDFSFNRFGFVMPTHIQTESYTDRHTDRHRPPFYNDPLPTEVSPSVDLLEIYLKHVRVRAKNGNLAKLTAKRRDWCTTLRAEIIYGCTRLTRNDDVPQPTAT